MNVPFLSLTRLVLWTMILNTDFVVTYMATNFILFFMFWDNDDRQMPTGKQSLRLYLICFSYYYEYLTLLWCSASSL